jgi:hypothetical protein
VVVAVAAHAGGASAEEPVDFLAALMNEGLRVELLRQLEKKLQDESTAWLDDFAGAGGCEFLVEALSGVLHKPSEYVSTPGEGGCFDCPPAAAAEMLLAGGGACSQSAAHRKPEDVALLELLVQILTMFLNGELAVLCCGFALA